MTRQPTCVENTMIAGLALDLAYDGRCIASGLDVDIPRGCITAIVGPNACGKSTLLRALSRLLAPRAGQVILDGKDIRRYRARELARKLGLLPQSCLAPPGIRVADLVARGRYPHLSPARQWSDADEAALCQAMADTGVTDLAERAVDDLSGGQRQRVWLAMALAQQTPVLLLDEPTTFLDIAHQLDLLALCRKLNRENGQTLVMVLHDLNQAARYADRLIAMRAGTILASGPPREVLTPALVERLFGIRCIVMPDPVDGSPLVIPLHTTPA